AIVRSQLAVLLAGRLVEDDTDDGDDPWTEFTATLSEGLLVIATANLLHTLEHRAYFGDCRTEQGRSLLVALECVCGADQGKAPTQVYFGPGVLVTCDPGANHALVGFDGAERRRGFLKQYSEAR